jgi:hypothetical protein
MTQDQIVVEVARDICANFLNEHRPTSRHDLMVRFEITNLLSEMETRGLCIRSLNQEDALPCSGSFAVLPSEDESYRRAEVAFSSTVRVLRHLFRTEGKGVSYAPDVLLQKAATMGEPLDAEGIALGLYLAQGREDYFPLYALNPDDHRPRKQMAEILRVFGDAKDGWGLAFWFAALNSFLDDERPQDVLAVDPDRVIAAAKDEMAGVQHG